MPWRAAAGPPWGRRPARSASHGVSVYRLVPEPLEHSREYIMGLGAWNQQPLIDEPSWDAAGTKLKRGLRVLPDRGVNAEGLRPSSR